MKTIENHYNKTYLIVPQKITILKRFTVNLSAINSDKSIIKDTHMQKEAEGAKIQYKVYGILPKGNYISSKGNPVNSADFAAIEKSITDKKITAVTVTSDPDKTTIVLTGKRLHSLLVVEDPTDCNFFIIIGSLNCNFYYMVG